jgi:hypothetical protein
METKEEQPWQKPSGIATTPLGTVREVSFEQP